MFIFQACYGTPQDFGSDSLVEGQVKSLTSGLPIKGIKVSVSGNLNYDTTDQEGKFSIYFEKLDSVVVRFEDIDSGENGLYQDTSKVIKEIDEKVYLEILMQEK